MRNTLIVDGVAMPAPSKIVITKSDVDSEDSGRNGKADLHRERLKVLYKLSLEFVQLTDTEAQLIDTAFSPVSVQVTFPFPGGGKTLTMYAGDRDFAPVISNDSAGKDKWAVSFSVTEF